MLKKTQGEQAIINPSIFKVAYRPVAKSVIIMFAKHHLRDYLTQGGHNPKKVRTITHSDYYPPTQKGAPGLAGPVVGAPAAVTLLEILIALGAKKVLGFGICGSMDNSLAIGDLFVPTKAISEEGTSRHYFPGQRVFNTNDALRDTVEKKLLEKNEPYRFGSIWTTDALFRETAQKVSDFQKKGVMAVDMETSALAAIARYRKIQFASLMVVSDELGSLRWKAGFKRPKLKKSLARTMELLSELRF